MRQWILIQDNRGSRWSFQSQRRPGGSKRTGMMQFLGRRFLAFLFPACCFAPCRCQRRSSDQRIPRYRRRTAYRSRGQSAAVRRGRGDRRFSHVMAHQSGLREKRRRLRRRRCCGDQRIRRGGGIQRIGRHRLRHEGLSRRDECLSDRHAVFVDENDLLHGTAGRGEAGVRDGGVDGSRDAAGEGQRRAVRGDAGWR